MNNYDVMLEAARKRFTQYDPAVILQNPGVTFDGQCYFTRFLGEEVRIDADTGVITLEGRKAGVGEALSVYDWLCDRKKYAAAAGDYCPVSSLPGVYVSGSGLFMDGGPMASCADREPERFASACTHMGGRAVKLGDMGYILPVFPDVSMCLKFYFSDEEFPASMSFLWDKNMLQFVRYETVYYIAGCLQQRLKRLLKKPSP